MIINLDERDNIGNDSMISYIQGCQNRDPT